MHVRTYVRTFVHTHKMSHADACALNVYTHTVVDHTSRRIHVLTHINSYVYTDVVCIAIFKSFYITLLAASDSLALAQLAMRLDN